jgi:hypothetical protein
MFKSTNFGLFLAAIAFSLPVMANAQAIPDLQGSITLGSQIDDIIKAQKERNRANALGEDETIDGEAGIYVLRRNEIFFVGGGVSTGYSNNPLRTADDVGGSYSVNFAASTGIQTKIAEKFDLGLSLNVSGVEYGEDFVPSSRTLNGSLNIGTPIGRTPLYLSVTGFGGWSFNSDFEQGTRFSGLSTALSAGLPMGRKTIVRPGLGVTRQWSERSENNSTSVAASLDIVHALSPRLSFSAVGSVSHVWFDDFYEDVTFTPRNDWQYSGEVSLSYRLSRNSSLSLSSSYEKRNSTFFLSAYESYDLSASLALRIRF